jgi:hypothetical protein
MWCGMRLLFIEMNLNDVFCPKSLHLILCQDVVSAQEKRRGEQSRGKYRYCCIDE